MCRHVTGEKDCTWQGQQCGLDQSQSHVTRVSKSTFVYILLCPVILLIISLAIGVFQHDMSYTDWMPMLLTSVLQSTRDLNAADITAAEHSHLGPCPIRLVVHSHSPSALAVMNIIQLHMCHADGMPMQDTDAGDVDPHDLGRQHICHMAPSEG